MVRRQHIEPETEQVNAAWQAKLREAGSIWQNYKLVMTQWPFLFNAAAADAYTAIPVPPCIGAAPGSATANVVLETFFQDAAVCDNQAKTSCMTCHNLSRQSDFVWSITVNRHKPAASQEQALPRRKAFEDLNAVKKD